MLRWAEESEKPNGERLPEYTDARKPQIEKQIGVRRADVSRRSSKPSSTAALGVMRDKLGAEHALVKQILAGQVAGRPRRGAGRRHQDLAMPRRASRCLPAAAAAVDASTDPIHRSSRRLIEPRARELRTKYDNEVLGVERDAYAKIAQAMFATQGESAYPDATFTLRLSYGGVKGYRRTASRSTPFTEIRGLYVRGDQHGQKPPYKIPGLLDQGARRRSS